MGRKRLYQRPGELGLAVDDYFDGISYQETVAVPDGERTVTKFLVPPSCAGLCLYLGMSRDTWSAYGKEKGFEEIVSRTRLRMEAYLVEQLAGRHVQGVIFNLKNNYGWKDKQEMSFDEETRNAMAGGEMTMAEKRRLLAAAAKEFCDDGDKQA